MWYSTTIHIVRRWALYSCQNAMMILAIVSALNFQRVCVRCFLRKSCNNNAENGPNNKRAAVWLMHLPLRCTMMAATGHFYYKHYEIARLISHFLISNASYTSQLIVVTRIFCSLYPFRFLAAGSHYSIYVICNASLFVYFSSLFLFFFHFFASPHLRTDLFSILMHINDLVVATVHWFSRGASSP